jgi:hypothetical protein
VNDKYKDYFNDEGEFLIPFEAIQRGQRPRRIRASAQIRLLIFGAAAISILCGLGWVVMLVMR